MSIVVGNELAVVKQAIRSTHGDAAADQLSGCYLADEIAGNYRAIDALLSECELDELARSSEKCFWNWCRRVARQIRPQAFYTNPRGPKRSPPKRTSGQHRHHDSTYRFLEEDKQRC